LLQTGHRVELAEGWALATAFFSADAATAAETDVNLLGSGEEDAAALICWVVAGFKDWDFLGAGEAAAAGLVALLDEDEDADDDEEGLGAGEAATLLLAAEEEVAVAVLLEEADFCTVGTALSREDEYASLSTFKNSGHSISPRLLACCSTILFNEAGLLACPKLRKTWPSSSALRAPLPSVSKARNTPTKASMSSCVNSVNFLAGP